MLAFFTDFAEYEFYKTLLTSDYVDADSLGMGNAEYVGAKFVFALNGQNLAYVTMTLANGTPGMEISFFENGAMQVYKTYNNGVLSNVQEYDENGVLLVRTSYYENGQPQSAEEYDENGQTRNVTQYYENGIQSYHAEYTDDTCSLAVYYTPDGEETGESL